MPVLQVPKQEHIGVVLLLPFFLLFFFSLFIKEQEILLSQASLEPFWRKNRSHSV